MDGQRDLFNEADRQAARLLAALRRVQDEPLPYPANAPDTARKGAVAAAGRAPAQVVQVLQYIADRTRVGDGATDWEGTQALGMLKSSYGARRRALEKAGLVRADTTTRQSKFGTANTVYVATYAVMTA